MKTVIAVLMGYVHHYHHTNGQADRKSANVDNAEQPLFNQVAPGNFNVIEYHIWFMVNSSWFIAEAFFLISYYSERRLFTGFTNAAFSAWCIIVTAAMITDASTATTKIIGPILI